MSVYWREASSVILAALNTQARNKFNYKLLFLKRSSKSKFMPNGLVFPGGALDSNDSHISWLKLFETFNINKKQLQLLESNCSPPMFTNIDSNGISKHIALRINAIRETFEETGILLCKSSNTAQERFSSAFLHHNLPDWRVKVNKNPEAFLEMCHVLKCYPDLWSLNLWSNWLTPRHENIKRFDTAFFIVTLKNIPETKVDETEIVEQTWLTPDQVLLSFKLKEIWLPPPQLYETERIKQFSLLESLAEFSGQQSVRGCQRWMPEYITTTNAAVFVLPGDEQYPDEIDLATAGDRPRLNMSAEEFRAKSHRLHRFEQYSQHDCKIYTSNISLDQGHIHPM